MPFTADSHLQRIIYTALVVVLCLVPIGEYAMVDHADDHVAVFHPLFNAYIDNDQYAYLADAFIQGRTWLDLPVSPDLAAMEHPYDYDARYNFATPDNPVFWDYAFYNGHYYCYFGAVPAVLLYVPYQLLTGTYLSTPMAIVALACLAAVALALLVWRVIARYFAKSATLGTALVCLMLLFAGSNITFLCFDARFYSVPMLASITVTSLGLWFWLGACRNGDGKPIQGSGAPTEADESCAYLRKWSLAAGSLFMALNLGCRPQFFLAAFLAIPLFWPQIRAGLLFRRSSLAATVAALTSFLIVGCLQMLYNGARFGNPIDFGADFNLTSFDMTKAVQKPLDTLGYAGYYLVAPLQLQGEFPFVSSYAVKGLSEPVFGGLFFLLPMALLVIALPLVWRELREKGLGVFCLSAIAFAVAIMLLDAHKAGLTERYYGDFGWFILLVAAVVVLCLQQRYAESNPTYWRCIWAFAVLGVGISVAIGFLGFFDDYRFANLAQTAPEFYRSALSFFGVSG